MKTNVNPKIIFKAKLLFCLMVLSSGLYLSLTNNSLINNAILGLGILVTNFSINKPLNQ